MRAFVSPPNTTTRSAAIPASTSTPFEKTRRSPRLPRARGRARPPRGGPRPGRGAREPPEQCPAVGGGPVDPRVEILRAGRGAVEAARERPVQAVADEGHHREHVQVRGPGEDASRLLEAAQV